MLRGPRAAVLRAWDDALIALVGEVLHSSPPQHARSLLNDDILDNMDGITIFFTFFVVVLIAGMVYGVYIVFGLPEDDRPTFEWFGKSEPWAPPTRTSPRRQELKPNTYFGM